MTAVHSVHIDAPVRKVFDFVKDPRNWGAQPGTARGPVPAVTITRAYLTEEGSGSYYTYVWRVAGIPVEGFGVNIEVVPGEQFTHLESLALLGTVTYRFEPEGTGTRLTLERQPRSIWRLPVLGTVVDLFWLRIIGAATAEWKERLEQHQPTPIRTPVHA